jgi:hypothetical protein
VDESATTPHDELLPGPAATRSPKASAEALDLGKKAVVTKERSWLRFDKLILVPFAAVAVLGVVAGDWVLVMFGVGFFIEILILLL